MARYGIVIDTERCMACYNCFIACKDEHCGFSTGVSAPQPHMGQSWIRIDSRERGEDTRKIKTLDISTPCLHCGDAACEKAASGGAVYTRPDGIVIIDPGKAKGQRQIVDACPVGAVYWNDELELPQKCTMCAHLLDEGYESPRCVEACPNGALIFGDLDDPRSDVCKAIAGGKVTPLDGIGKAVTNVIHLNIPVVFAAGSVYLPGDEPADGAKVTLTNNKTGGVLETGTNYFGDWEFELPEKGAEYTLEVEHEGYRTYTARFAADTDRFLGEIVLER